MLRGKPGLRYDVVPTFNDSVHFKSSKTCALWKFEVQSFSGILNYLATQIGKTMKGRRLVSIILGITAATSCIAQYLPPLAKIEPLYPVGLRVSIPDEPGITLMAVHANINVEFEGLEAGTIARDILRVRNNRWTYEDRSTRLKIGDTIYYWIYVIKDGLGYQRLFQEHKVTEFFTYDGTPYRPVRPGVDLDMPNRNKPDTTNAPCATSTTIYNGNQPCAGVLLFEDHFNRIETSRWRTVKQIPAAPEYEFVVYQDNEENLFVKDGELNVKPTLVQNRYNRQFVRSGELIIENCTGEPGSAECQRKAQGFHILPPVYSALIDTKRSFNFLYGRVEIRAKLPLGDWIYPVINLQALDNAYGSGYPSGLLKIACAAGNRNLRSATGQNLDAKELRAGAVVSPEGDIRSNTMSQKSSFKFWGNDYHVYELVWSPSRIIVKVDGELYGEKEDPASHYATRVLQNTTSRWSSSNAPFDKPFYLSLGVAVGGHGEFPDNCISGEHAKPWRNIESKALLNFFNAQDQWSSTWRTDETALKIDYVKVWAL